jgi:hypothetical protein
MADYSNCPSNRLCIYFDPDGNGYKFELAGSVPFLGAFDDQISSVYNNSGFWACLWTDPYYSGVGVSLAPYSALTLTGEADDKISSISFPR